MAVVGGMAVAVVEVVHVVAVLDGLVAAPVGMLVIMLVLDVPGRLALVPVPVVGPVQVPVVGVVGVVAMRHGCVPAPRVVLVGVPTVLQMCLGFHGGLSTPRRETVS
jgi:hypothetical protein